MKTESELMNPTAARNLRRRISLDLVEKPDHNDGASRVASFLEDHSMKPSSQNFKESVHDGLKRMKTEKDLLAKKEHSNISKFRTLMTTSYTEPLNKLG